MTFEEIFQTDGYYIADDFATGFCFRIFGGVIYWLQYDNENDFSPDTGIFPVQKGQFKKDYRRLMAISELFKTPIPEPTTPQP